MGVGAACGDVVATLGFISPEHAGFIEAAGARGHIGFDADNWLDPRLFAGIVELVGPKHVAVVGDG